MLASTVQFSNNNQHQPQHPTQEHQKPAQHKKPPTPKAHMIPQDPTACHTTNIDDSTHEQTPTVTHTATKQEKPTTHHHDKHSGTHLALNAP